MNNFILRTLFYLILIKFSLFAQKSLEKATFKVLDVEVNPKLYAPESEFTLIQEKVKKKNWLSVTIKYEIKNTDRDDKSLNEIVIIGDFVSPDSKDKNNFYVFSKSLSYSTVPRRGEFYAVFLIPPRLIENYFGNAANLVKKIIW